MTDFHIGDIVEFRNEDGSISHDKNYTGYVVKVEKNEKNEHIYVYMPFIYTNTIKDKTLKSSHNIEVYFKANLVMFPSADYLVLIKKGLKHGDKIILKDGRKTIVKDIEFHSQSPYWFVQEFNGLYAYTDIGDFNFIDIDYIIKPFIHHRFKTRKQIPWSHNKPWYENI